MSPFGFNFNTGNNNGMGNFNENDLVGEVRRLRERVFQLERQIQELRNMIQNSNMGGGGFNNNAMGGLNDMDMNMNNGMDDMNNNW